MSDKHDPFSPHGARGPEYVIKDTAGASAESKARVVKFWAPMVQVEDPLVVRAHWETVIKGCLWSLLVAIPIGAVTAAVG